MEGEVHLIRGEDGVAEIVLDRPAKHNAVTPEMAEAIARHAAAVDADPALRCVLLRGAGDRAFCSGTDLNALAAYPDLWSFRNRVEYSTSVREIRKPVVAALKGWALGGGFELALAADIRVAGRSLRAGFPEVTRGWVGGGGASQMLPRLVGYGQAMRLLLTGETVDAEEARALGMVEVVAEDADHEQAARAIARRIAGFSPVATQSVKASVRMAMQAPLPAGLAYENEMNVLCFAAGDHMEGIRAFAEKREAAFKR
ncbi:enoyl-CoA hydratase/isomerase family protein [Roseomonas alkaliterrae]|uniref:Enoyl-CoA hydratase/carnithine racemase n=1 Tax=Neoroseomonas alkaliterrae TaxID=1452450 RepID=A0A840XU53_9PROT|nr:enoyl-CoA hydratase/isomerase family protein [Neoroseomonas alkaliterrae]MBB5690179.1 enoyl-CoA hydratase/carnithine racemase [Neoroseomonas alkaliterrae]MBR0674767.1 enoyl-CoA hydratase/isomerase family protein [Neoroseomonas alkaliterrae]